MIVFGRHAVVDDKRLRLDPSLNDIEEAQGYVAAEASVSILVPPA